MFWSVFFVFLNDELLFLVKIIMNIVLSFFFLRILYLQDINCWIKRVVEITTFYCVNILSTSHILDRRSVGCYNFPAYEVH